MLITRFVKIKNSTNYTDHLGDILENYNTSIHSSIKTDPKYALENNMTFTHVNDVSDGEEFDAFEKNKLETGVRVRTLLKRTITSKGHIPRYSKTTYKVIKRVGIKYQLQNETTGDVLEHLYPRHKLQVIDEVIDNKEDSGDEKDKKEGIDKVIAIRKGENVKEDGLDTII